MDRSLLTAMLASREELTAEGLTYTVGEGAHVALLLRSASGSHVPVHRVSALSLAEDFLTVTAEGADLCLPYGAVLGLKVEGAKGKAVPMRTGFRP